MAAMPIYGKTKNKKKQNKKKQQQKIIKHTLKNLLPQNQESFETESLYMA